MDSAQYTNPKHFNAYTGAATPPIDTHRSSTTPSRDTHRSAVTPSPSNAKNNPKNDSNISTSGNDRHAQLTQKLSQYTRGSDRRQVLRSLMDPQQLPRMHTLKSVWVEDIAAAEREAARERAALNGVKFLQVKSYLATGSDERPDVRNPVDSYFLQTLREICGHMCDMDGVDADPMALYGGLLLRLSRSVSERDALEIVTQWACGKGELVALPLKRRHHDPSSKLAVPIDVELYVESGNVHAKVTMSHVLGLYRRTDLESHGLKRELSPWNALILANQNPSMQASSSKKLSKIQYETLASPKFLNIKPWIFIDADVVERINFGTGSSVRMLHVSVPEDKNSGYVKKW
mmetsp:Transcript_7848/g.13662  ORF Transcript_7848/g.13662 Transcript_7848/m.13662 type:complete len:347 (+) Transcript_7848:271-1311(+)